MSSSRAGPPPPGGASSSSAARQTLLCNKCRKPIATTCFLCACDCIFCEDCTYDHFNSSSQCPSCNQVLSENDFTELVVADGTRGSTSDITKTSLQALFTKKSSTSFLPFQDLCNSLIRQIEVTKTSTKFLLKQFLKDASAHGHQSSHLVRSYEAMKHEITQLKQAHSTQRLQLEQVNADLQNRLQAREAACASLQKKIEGQEKMLDQFRRLHGGMTPHTPGSHKRSAPPSPSQQSLRGSEPPLKGFMMQKEARERAQQQAYQTHRAPSVLGRSQSRSTSDSMRPSSHLGHAHSNVTPIQTAPRPYSSSNSIGSASGAPRIRDLSSRSGYTFTSTTGGRPFSGGGQGSHQHINKRRRPSSAGMASTHQAMSPNTAFTLNRGPQSGRPQYNRVSNGYGRR